MKLLDPDIIAEVKPWYNRWKYYRTIDMYESTENIL